MGQPTLGVGIVQASHMWTLFSLLLTAYEAMGVKQSQHDSSLADVLGLLEDLETKNKMLTEEDAVEMTKFRFISSIIIAESNLKLSDVEMRH